MAKSSAGCDARPWLGEARPMPFKFNERAMLPCCLTRGDAGPWEYVCMGGERVRLEYRATFDNSRGGSSAELERRAQELHGLPFAAVEAVWARRVGRLDGWWNIVRMVKVNA